MTNNLRELKLLDERIVGSRVGSVKGLSLKVVPDSSPSRQKHRFLELPIRLGQNRKSSELIKRFCTGHVTATNCR